MKISKFQFLNPYLVELNFNENQNFHRENNQEIEIQSDFDIQVQRDSEENIAKVQLTLNINEDDEDAPFKLNIKVASDFIWEDMEEKTVENLLHVNAPALLLGYMRPIVANITNVSSFPVYNLPFVNFKE